MSLTIDSKQFEVLHKVKGTRFDMAQREVVKKRDFLESAQKNLDETIQARAEFASFRAAEKRRLYDEEQQSGGIKLGAINNVNYELSQLQQRAMVYQQKEEDASKHVAQAQLDLQQAQENLQKAHRTLSKYDELGVDVRKQQLKQEELVQEREFEDFRPMHDVFG